MGNRLLNEPFIRQRSMELQVPFENLLVASVLEEIVQRIAESEYADSIWMKNSLKLNLESYRNRVERSLSFFIEDTESLHYKKTEVSEMFSVLFRNFKKDAVHWNYRVYMDWNIIYADLLAEVSMIQIPVKLKFEQARVEHAEPYERSLKLFINNNRMIQIKCFPSEHLAIEKLMELLDKLELINDLSCYMELYDILRKEALSGRKICELLKINCVEHGIEIEERRMQMLLSYRKNGYMKKKWKSYIRHEKRKNPTWDEVMDILEKFLLNIWEYMCRGYIYLGDWVPELGRFID